MSETIFQHWMSPCAIWVLLLLASGESVLGPGSQILGIQARCAAETKATLAASGLRPPSGVAHLATLRNATASGVYSVE